MKRFFKLLNVYNKYLKSHRFHVQAVQISLVMGLGDVIAQKISKQQPYDGKRTLRFMSLGLILGPVTDRWFMFIDDFIGKEMTLFKGVQKSLMDQVFGNPVYIAVLLSGISLAEGKDLEGIKQSLKNDYLDVLLASYMVWPLVQVVNFTLVPSQYRVLQLQLVEIGWNAYVSWKTHKKSNGSTTNKDGVKE